MKVAVLDDYAKVSQQCADWSRLKACDVTVFHDTLTEHDALVARLESFDVICMMRERTPFPAQLMDALPNLKLLVTSGPRNLSIDLEAATRNNVVVCGTESRKTTTSELATLLMLSLSRNLIPETQSMHVAGWQSSLGRDLHGLSLGLIGLGKIGQQMSVIGKALGMEIHAWSSNLTAEQCAQHEVIFESSLPDLMAASDVVSVHLVHSARTDGLIDAQAFASMRERALFINTSRGPIADEHALLEGMRIGRPWKAALDVYGTEPLPWEHELRDKELVESGRLLLSPHLGYVTEQTWEIFYGQTVDAIEAWLKQQPIRVLN